MSAWRISASSSVCSEWICASSSERRMLCACNGGSKRGSHSTMASTADLSESALGSSVSGCETYCAMRSHTCLLRIALRSSLMPCSVMAGSLMYTSAIMRCARFLPSILVRKMSATPLSSLTGLARRKTALIGVKGIKVYIRLSDPRFYKCVCVCESQSQLNHVGNGNGVMVEEPFRCRHQHASR